MKNMAICIAGLHWEENYKNPYREHNIKIDYNKYVKNIKTKIYKYFEKDYQIDTFICTQHSNMIDNLIQTYNPTQCIFENKNHCFKKLKVLKVLQEQINNSSKNYDLVLLTRFDIYLLDDFTTTNINLNKLNIVSILEHDRVCDDNLFIFPIPYLKPITRILENQLSKYSNPDAIHYLKNSFENQLDINYIKNEFVKVSFLTFYKLHFFENNAFMIDNLYSENCSYYGPKYNSELIIKNGIYQFTKLISTPGDFCWLGINLDKIGIYHLSFEMYSNKEINIEFIKLHKPSRFYRVNKINANEWTFIDMYIETKEINDLLCFIFDELPETIQVLFKNISYEIIDSIDIDIDIDIELNKVIYTEINDSIKNKELILNQLNHQHNIFYSKNNTSQLIWNKEDNLYEFCKLVPTVSSFCWFGLTIEEIGFHHLSFEIYTNKDINFDFIKSHEPIQFYKTNCIIANKWTKIDILIETKSVPDLLCFIFDDYSESIKILYKNISCVKIDKGFIINEIECREYLSNKCTFKKINDNSFEFNKEKTNGYVPFLWCGYFYNPKNIIINIKFDICFISDVPTINDKFFIKTHSPLHTENTWLTKCKKDEFVNIMIPFSIELENQLILFIMDECELHIHFIIKNFEIV
jgi:hypothetical protein